MVSSFGAVLSVHLEVVFMTQSVVSATCLMVGALVG